VLSRYKAVAGYDWIAIPLVPYLYAVEKREDMPLFTDAKLVAFLRDRYRRDHLESLIPILRWRNTRWKLVRIGRSLVPPHHLRIRD